MGIVIPVAPMLHVGQAMLRPMTLDPGVAALALAAFVLATEITWVPASRSLRRVVQRRLVRATAAVLVLLAVLPSVLPYDHLMVHETHASTPDEAVHASHCHISPGTCTDAPVTSGPGQMLLAEPLLVAPAMLAVLLIATIALRPGITHRPELRPPLPLTAV